MDQLNPDRISRLIADSMTDSLSSAEREELEVWAAQSPQNRQFLDLLGDAESAREMTQRVCRHDAEAGWLRVERRVRKRRMLRFAVPLAGFAAAVAVVTGAFFTAPRVPEQLAPAITTAVAPGVTLLRATGEVIAVDSVRRIELAGAVARSNGRELTVQADCPSDKVLVSEVCVPAGRRFTVSLSDGTRVELNAASRLRFPEQFDARGPREVTLSGEAYFEVSKDAGRPFIVHAGEGYVRVTGTEFNVSCYDDEPALVATLVGGCVLVGGASEPEVTLVPGMQALRDKATGGVTTRMVDVDDFTAWTQDLFAFRESSLSEVMASVARWYGCRVEFDNPACAAIRFTGRVSRSSTLEEVAAFFTHTGEVSVEVHEGVVVVR